MAVIYRIKCLDASIKESYIGSTVNFKKRMSSHKRTCHNENNKNYNQPLYKFIRENGGFEDWTMTIIDSLTTTDKNEVEKCERNYIEQQEFRLNKQLPLRTRKEYRLDHKEYNVEYMKQYHQDHKEELAEYKKQYAQSNREEQAEYQKQYREANREKINKRQLEKVQCERCSAFITRSAFSRHQRTKKCMNAN